MFLFLVGLACLFPLTLYCLYLAMLHHRSRPTMMSGAWDTAGMLLALSGFLVVGGSTLVFTLHGSAHDWLVRGSTFHDLRRLSTQESQLTWILWGGYLLVVVGGSIALMRQREDTTSLYNIAPEELEDLLKATFARLNLPVERRGARWLLGPAGDPRAVLEADGSAPMRHVSLTWVFAGPALRRELEAELERELVSFSTPESSTSNWFMTVAGALFFLMVFLLGTFLLILFRQ